MRRLGTGKVLQDVQGRGTKQFKMLVLQGALREAENFAVI